MENVVSSILNLTFFCNIRRQIYNGLWPTTWDYLLGALVVILLVMNIDHPKLNVLSYYLWAFGDYLYLDETYPYSFRMFMIALISSVLYFVFVLYSRQFLMRVLLAYKGWLCKEISTLIYVDMFWTYFRISSNYVFHFICFVYFTLCDINIAY